MRPSILALSVLLAGACYDPVHADEVAALGPETPGIPEGPTHRAGQRCTTCHGGRGPSDTEYSLAGTVSRTRGKPEPLVDGTVSFTDAAGKTISATTNSVGNFWITKDSFDPVFPVRVTLQGEGIFRRMTTSIGRDGGCATCHRAEGSDPQHTGPIFLRLE
ncbi:MAG: hypothetical protein KIT84_04495 [Labilithrix sp.]|nr:hypothetical protein [Labilithrix sp.]MCW5810245.1 hypothetical protein [Labilithrix sp.]